MRSKSDTGTSLYRINWDVGVVNDLSVENQSKHTSKNTVTHRIKRMEKMYVHTTDKYYPLQNRAKFVIIIIKEKSKRIRVQRNIS